MILRLSESPTIHYRDDLAVVIFPSRPYWFSATSEIAEVLKAIELGETGKALRAIEDSLEVSAEEALEIYTETVELLHSSGVLSLDGEFAETIIHQPNFQVNDVENVLVIATTQKCNMGCAMCYALAKEALPNEMTTAEIKAIVDQLAKMPWQNAVSRVALTGGELFTRPDAIELIEYVHGHGFFAQVNTNATLLNEDQISKLAKFPRLKMSVSLDGCQTASHDFIRGPGAFATTVENIRLLCEAGVSVAVNMFVHGGNVGEIKETLRLADSLGVSGFNCLNMMNVGRGNSKKAKQALIAVPLAEFYHKVYEAVRDDERAQKLMMNSTFANQIMGIAGGVKSFGCGIGTNRAVYVKSDGTLYPCADAALPAFRLGNLRTENLADIWENSPVLQELRALNIDSMNPKCSACSVRYLCAGNCRGENYQTTKDIKSPHFKCEEIYESVLELMWILTEDPDLFKCKVDNLYETVSSHASSA